MQSGPTYFFPRAKNRSSVGPKAKKPLPVLFLKTNSYFSLSLIIFIHK
jgi:hypothetical protein